MYFAVLKHRISKQIHSLASEFCRQFLLYFVLFLELTPKNVIWYLPEPVNLAKEYFRKCEYVFYAVHFLLITWE